MRSPDRIVIEYNIKCMLNIFTDLVLTRLNSVSKICFFSARLGIPHTPVDADRISSINSGARNPMSIVICLFLHGANSLYVIRKIILLPTLE